MFVQVLAGAILLFLLFSLFRFAMGLRWAKVSREAARAEVEGEGRRVVAELPLATGEVVLLTEDEEGFAWGAGARVDKSGLVGVRMRLNGGVLAEHVREGARLPPPEPLRGVRGTGALGRGGLRGGRVGHVDPLRCPARRREPRGRGHGLRGGQAPPSPRR